MFLSYVLSYPYVAIYWHNQHYLLHLVRHIDGRVLWANRLLLLWLSLVPFATSWMGHTHLTKWPVMLYGSLPAYSFNRRSRSVYAPCRSVIV